MLHYNTIAAPENQAGTLEPFGFPAAFTGKHPAKQIIKRERVNNNSFQKETINMNTKMKNIPKAEILQLDNQIQYLEGQVVSKTLAQNDYVSITLFAFDKGEEISTHASGGDAMVTVLDGTGKFTISGKEYILTKNDAIVMPAGEPHAVFGQERFKMLLTVVF